jgi:hypothetical protein
LAHATLLLLPVVTLPKGGRTCHVSLGGGKGFTGGTPNESRTLRRRLVVLGSANMVRL